MSLLHVRIVSPAGLSDGVQAVLQDQRGATNLVVLPGAARDPAGDLIQADVARECVQDIISDLRLDQLARSRYCDRRWHAPRGTRRAR
jgi:hypothetical protein